MNDNYAFLQGWFKQFPQYGPGTRDFYISGESYGGHYVPQLSWTILNHNNPFQLKGFLVGNAWTDDTIDTNSVPPFIWGHALCSYATYQNVLSACDLDASDLERPSKIQRGQIQYDDLLSKLRSDTPVCDQALNTMYNEVSNLINEYDIYWPCIGNVGLGCMNYTKQTVYLNRMDVKTAIHANTTLPWSWQVCGGSPLFNYVNPWDSVVWIYPELMSSLPKVTVFSGDVTFNVPFIGSEVWIEGLGRPTASHWHYWLVDGQVAGFYKEYDTIHFVTVKDAGHMVATYQPLRAEVMLQNYLKGVF